MKIVVLGAGGWGALVGAHLARAGAEVTLLFRRQAHVDAIRQNGGLILEGSERTVIPVNATTDPQQLSAADLMIVAVKNQDTPAALESVAHLQVGAVASVQNGLGHAEKFRQYFPTQDILMMISRISGSLLDYGRVHRGDDNFPTWIGDAYQGITPLVDKIVGLFNQSGLLAYASQDVAAVEWCKLLWWVPTSVAAVLCRLPTTQMMQLPDMAYLMARMTRDGYAVAQAAGVEVKDYETIEVLGRCQGEIEANVRYLIDQGRAWEEHGGQGYRQGMLLDVERGRRTEAEDTLGFIVRMARKYRVSIPYLETAYCVIRGLDQVHA